MVFGPTLDSISDVAVKVSVRAVDENGDVIKQLDDWKTVYYGSAWDVDRKTALETPGYMAGWTYSRLSPDSDPEHGVANVGTSDKMIVYVYHKNPTMSIAGDVTASMRATVTTRGATSDQIQSELTSGSSITAECVMAKDSAPCSDIVLMKDGSNVTSADNKVALASTITAQDVASSPSDRTDVYSKPTGLSSSIADEMRFPEKTATHVFRTKQTTPAVDRWTMDLQEKTIKVNVYEDNGAWKVIVDNVPEFIDVRNVVLPDNVIRVKKNLRGREWTDTDSFKFELKDANSNVLQTIETTKDSIDNTVRFSDISYSPETASHDYIVDEIEPTTPESNMRYSKARYTVHVEIAYDDADGWVAKVVSIVKTSDDYGVATSENMDTSAPMMFTNDKTTLDSMPNTGSHEILVLFMLVSSLSYCVMLGCRKLLLNA